MWQRRIINLEASQSSETKQVFCHRLDEGGRLKGWPWVDWVVTQGFSSSVSFGEEVEDTALSFLLGLQSNTEQKL